MKKVVLYPLLICVAVALCANCLTLLLLWSVTNKGITLMSLLCVSLSAVSQVILGLLATWFITDKLDGSNQVTSLEMHRRALGENLKKANLRNSKNTINNCHIKGGSK